MISSTLREKVFQYFESKVTKAQLEEWLVPNLPVFLKDPNSADADVVSAIELGLAEMAQGIRNENSFRELLKEILKEQSLVLSSVSWNLVQRNPMTESFSSNRTENIRRITFTPHVFMTMQAVNS